MLLQQNHGFLDGGVQQKGESPELQRAPVLVRLTIIGHAHHREVVMGRPLAVHDVTQVADVLQHKLRGEAVRSVGVGPRSIVHAHSAIVPRRRQPRLCITKCYDMCKCDGNPDSIGL